MAKKSADDLVLEMMETVRKRKAEIKSLGRPNWLTTCTIGYNPDSVSDRIMIQTVTNVTKLIELYTFLLSKEQYWAQACKDMGLEQVKGASYTAPVYMGYSISAWKADLITRVNFLSIDQKKKELDALTAKLNSLMSLEQKREMELALIAEELA